MSLKLQLSSTPKLPKTQLKKSFTPSARNSSILQLTQTWNPNKSYQIKVNDEEEHQTKFGIRRQSDPQIDIPSQESQEKFFSIGEKIEGNDSNTEQFFKREPAVILKIIKSDTNNLSLWDFGYLDVFICEVMGPEEQLEEMENECAVFIPLHISEAIKRPFEIDDILIVEKPFFLIKDMSPQLLVAPIIYSNPGSPKSQTLNLL